MTTGTISEPSRGGPLVATIAGLVRLYERIPRDLIAIIARIAVGLTFWNSGLTKIDGFAIADKTFFLFREVYKVPLIPPDVAAYLSTAAELTCPILLWIGLATRFSATALLFMTLVIELFVFPEAYVTHGLWAVALLFLMVNGAGTFSVDWLLRRKFMD